MEFLDLQEKEEEEEDKARCRHTPITLDQWEAKVGQSLGLVSVVPALVSVRDLYTKSGD